MKKNHNKEKSLKNLENQFQQLGKETKAPDDLKKEVFNTLDTLNLFADIADLFTVKFSMTEIEALGLASEEEASATDETEIAMKKEETTEKPNKGTKNI